MIFKAKVIVLVLCLLVGIILISGCETAKGAVYGVGCTVEGAAKDIEGLGGAIIKADNWLKENLW